MARRIIQLATASPALSESSNLLSSNKRVLTGTLFALCNDGSVWSSELDPEDDSAKDWKRLPDVPQD